MKRAAATALVEQIQADIPDVRAELLFDGSRVGYCVRLTCDYYPTMLVMHADKWPALLPRYRAAKDAPPKEIRTTWRTA